MFEIQSIVLKNTLLVISVISLCFFIAPLFAGILNFGNAVGMIFFSLLTAFLIFNKSISQFLGRTSSTAHGKIIVYGLSILIIAGIILCIVISAFMVKSAHFNKPPNPQNMIVLGCKVKDGRPSLMLKRRLDTALEYSENNEGTIVVSGGKGADEAISEAQCMKEYLVSKGVSPERIVMEDKSENTKQNLKFSKSLLENLNADTESLIIVTDGYHQLRASMIAKKAGLHNTYALSANTSPWLLPTYYVLEWFAVVNEFLRC